MLVLYFQPVCLSGASESNHRHFARAVSVLRLSASHVQELWQVAYVGAAVAWVVHMQMQYLERIFFPFFSIIFVEVFHEQKLLSAMSVFHSEMLSFYKVLLHILYVLI